MQTVLFHEIIFGPIHSRRLGISLGVNLLPVDGKLCSFDCVYCECGYNAQGVGKSGLPSSDRVEEELKSRLQSMHEAGEKLDVITFAGNGEPTLHPEFEKIIDTTPYPSGSLLSRSQDKRTIQRYPHSRRIGVQGIEQGR